MKERVINLEEGIAKTLVNLDKIMKKLEELDQNLNDKTSLMLEIVPFMM